MFRELANLSGLSLERLASLCEVAEAGSIGQAARGDSNRQSLLSRQIAELEAVFGVPLLARQSRPFRLTDDGQELARAAKDFFLSAGDLRRRAQQHSLRVVVGAGESLIQWLLFPACERIRQQSAERIVFAFRNLESARLVEALQQGEVDLALVRLEEVPPSLQHSKPWRYEQTAFVPKALSRTATALTAHELADLPWAVLEGHGHFRQFLEARAADAGGALHAALECSSYPQIAAAVKCGRYAGFLPEFAKSYFTGDGAVVQRSLAEPLHYERALALAWREAGLRSRPFLTNVLEELVTRLDKAFRRGR